LHASNIVIGPSDQLYVHPSATVYATTFNTNDGPIFIDADAEIMEGSHIRGPFYLGQHATLKLGTKIYGATTIGPQCKVGGEISNSIFWGYSNKAHDGFVGNSIIGEWCNLGADTNTSNLKNNYSNVKIWSYAQNGLADTGLTFCGLIMGDHSKCGINTMFNTGTVVGVGANIFGGDFPPKHVPSFSWGGPGGWEVYDLAKASATIEKVMARRSLTLTPATQNLLQYIFDQTAPQRNAS
jgi:UDP-N-acetylglucosamine diphosphorylase/glucosamine-1-phosphate N-acetyltransferase